MDDFPGLLTRDFGYRPQGKSAPMAPSKAASTAGTLNFDTGSGGAADHTRSSSSSFHKATKSGSILDDQDRDGLLFSDVFGGPPKYTSGAGGASPSAFDYDSIFQGSNAKASSLPVYDKPVYDDDIFDGLPGLKSSSSSSSVKYNDVFSSISSPPKQSAHFDDLLGNLGKTERKSSGVEKDVSSFDDLLPGFGRSSSPSNRPNSESSGPHKPTSDSTKTTSNVLENPFAVLESTSSPVVSSSGLFVDPLDQISKLSNSGNDKGNGSSINGGVFDVLDPLETNKSGKDRSPLKTARSMSGTKTHANEELSEKSSMKTSASNSQKKMNQEFHQTLFNMPTISTESHNFFGQTASPPLYVNANPIETNSQVGTSPRSEENLVPSNDIWLTVSEIPLFTQPTSAPPPSRPPPPRPARVSKSEIGSFTSTNAGKKVDEFSSFSNSTQYSHSPKFTHTRTKSPMVSQIDELEEFAMGRTRNNIDENADVISREEIETNSVAAAAMKEAMDRAEAKFRHAKEAREREYLKASRSKETVQLEKDEKDMQYSREREVRENQGRLDRERQQREREEEEREQRRLEKESERAREIEREREKARQAVERATREARERAAAEARLKAERAFVGKANAEARERAERVAVQRAQAEARERAATDARERAEKAAAEARERANAEAREKEARERAAAVRADAEGRLRAERAAVERAAAEARERATAFAKANQQKNENDLESFFNMGARPSSAPRPRANSSDPAIDPQFQSRGGPEVAKRTPVGASSNIRKASSTTNIVDDLSSIFGAAPSSGEFQEVEGESEERRRARLERNQRTQERAAKALAEKNQRDLQTQRDQAERHRIAETLDAEIKRWASGKEGNLRALLSTLQYVLWPECGWQPVSLTDLITGASVKKAYRKATLCIHPDKVQQKGANLQQKYIAEKVFDLLKEAWNKLNSEELF